MFFSPLFIKDAKNIQKRNLDDSYEEKKEEDDWYMIRQKQGLGMPFTADPNGLRDLDTEVTEEDRKEANKVARTGSGLNQIVEEFKADKGD